MFTYPRLAGLYNYESDDYVNSVAIRGNPPELHRVLHRVA